MEEYKPPFSINDDIINTIAEISELIGHISVTSGLSSNPKLRRINRIKTIQASLAIENNTLSLEQVTALLNGKRIAGSVQEIREVKNAYETYNRLTKFNPLKIKDLLSAHAILMDGLVEGAGKFRHSGVGVFDGEHVVHMAPPSDLVPELIRNLLKWYKQSNLHPLVKSIVFHYEFEFIHPFADGNGRMGRLWHTLLLMQWKKILAWVPVESLVKERQQDYYAALGRADKLADSTCFIEFMLAAMRDTLKNIVQSDQENDYVSDHVSDHVKEHVNSLLKILGDRALSIAEMMEMLRMKHRPTFRKNYLNPALQSGVIEMTIPDKPRSRNQKYKKKNIHYTKRA